MNAAPRIGVPLTRRNTPRGTQFAELSRSQRAYYASVKLRHRGGQTRRPAIPRSMRSRGSPREASDPWW